MHLLTHHITDQELDLNRSSTLECMRYILFSNCLLARALNFCIWRWKTRSLSLSSSLQTGWRAKTYRLLKSAKVWLITNIHARYKMFLLWVVFCQLDEMRSNCFVEFPKMERTNHTGTTQVKLTLVSTHTLYIKWFRQVSWK